MDAAPLAFPYNYFMQPSEQQADRRPVFSPLAIAVFTLFAVAVLWAAWRIVHPFLTPILLAVVVVTLTFPMYERLTKRVGGRPNLAATGMLGFITLVIVIPGLVLALLLTQQAVTIFQDLESGNYQAFFSSLPLSAWGARIQRLLPWMNVNEIRVDQIVMGLVRQIPAFVATQGTRLISGFFGIVIGFLFMLLASFVFYTKGRDMLREVRTLSPLPDVYDDQIFDKFRGVVDATFRGQLLTALAQGAVAGIGLAIAGVPGAALWGAVAAVFSLIPMVGAAAVWVPASIYLGFLASQGSAGWWRMIFLIAWGALVVSLVDNLVRPLVMRAGVNMHPIILFFAILGGLQAFGFTGLVLGPLVFVLLVTIVDIYKRAFLSRIESRAVVAPPPPG